MNNRERRIRERYQQRQAEAQRHRSPTASDDCQVEVYGETSFDWWIIDDVGSDTDPITFIHRSNLDGPGLGEWLRVKDDWTDLAAFERKCRRYGFPDTHPYGKLKEGPTIRMTFDKYSL